MPITNPQKAAHLNVAGTEVGLGPVPTLWSPSLLDSDLLAWFDKRDAESLTIDEDGKLLGWSSQVGEYSVVARPPSEGAGTPTVTTVDGETIISFDAGTGGITGSVLSTAPGEAPLNDAGVTIFVVARRGVQFDGPAVGFRPLVVAPVALRSGVRQQGFVTLYRPGKDPTQALFGVGQHTNDPANNVSLSGFVAGDKALLIGDFAATPLIGARLDGGGVVTGAPYFNTPENRFSIGGAYNTNDSAVVADIDCVIVTKAGLSAANRQKLEGWFAWSFGTQARLPTTHPCFSDGPYA